MSVIAHSCAGASPSRPPRRAHSGLSDRLRCIVGRFRRPNLNDRRGPEMVTRCRLALERDPLALVRELER